MLRARLKRMNGTNEAAAPAADREHRAERRRNARSRTVTTARATAESNSVDTLIVRPAWVMSRWSGREMRPSLRSETFRKATLLNCWSGFSRRDVFGADRFGRVLQPLPQLHAFGLFPPRHEQPVQTR